MDSIEVPLPSNQHPTVIVREDPGLIDHEVEYEWTDPVSGLLQTKGGNWGNYKRVVSYGLEWDTLRRYVQSRCPVPSGVPFLIYVDSVACATLRMDMDSLHTSYRIFNCSATPSIQSGPVFTSKVASRSPDPSILSVFLSSTTEPVTAASGRRGPGLRIYWKSPQPKLQSSDVDFSPFGQDLSYAVLDQAIQDFARNNLVRRIYEIRVDDKNFASLKTSLSSYVLTLTTAVPSGPPSLDPWKELEERVRSIPDRIKGCECGVDAIGGGIHSSWCPKAGA